MHLGKVLLIAMLLLFLTQVAVAAEPPDAPSATLAANRPLPAVRDTGVLAVEPAAAVVTLEKPARTKPVGKVIDSKFIALTGLATGLTVMDYEMTQRCLALRTCVEADPLLPHSRLGMYGTNIPINAALFWWSYKRKADGKRLWWLPTLAVIASHAVGVGTNIRFLK